MVLSREQIIDFIKKPKSENLIVRARELFAAHRLHVKGIGVQEFLAQIEGYENEAQYNLRKKLAKPATVPIVSKETEPFTKIFSAQGFSRYYQFADGGQEKLERDFREYLGGDIGDGENMFQWMKQWLDKVNFDSSGVFMIELPAEATIVPEPYLTFRSILEIHDYSFRGNKVEYIIFKTEKRTSDGVRYDEYRVVDDKFDYIVRAKDGAFQIIDDLTIPNPFGFVPARVISNQRDSISKARTTFIWKAIETCDEYLLDASIQVITKKLHGFPRFWARQKDCRKCKGSGYISLIGPDKITPIKNKCDDCKGLGHALKQDVSDITIVPNLTEQGQPDNVPVMGYVQPELETPKQQVEELERLAKVIHIGIWSNNDQERSSKLSETATGRILDVQALWDKLQSVSENAQEVELFVTNTMGAIRYGSAYKGAIINYGKKYFVRTADEVEQLYLTAKKGGLPSSLLDAYVEEIIYIRFGNDPLELQRQLKLNEIEPFIHLSDAEVRDLTVTADDRLMKVYFSDYIERFEREERPVVMATTEEILAKITEYNKAKMLEMAPSTPGPEIN